MTELTHKINDYFSIQLQDAGKPYEGYTNKKGKVIAPGISKESITIVSPFGRLNISPNELLGIWASQKNADLVAEVKRRADHK